MQAIRKRKPGLFGSTAPNPTPGDDVERQRGGTIEQMPAGLGMQSPEPKRRSILPYAFAAIEDTLSRQMGYQPQGVSRLNAMQQQQQQQAAQMAAEQRKRSLDMADWQAKEQWKRENPMPTNNDTVADFEFIQERLGPEAAETYLRNRADPPQYRQGPDGRFYRIETGQAPTAPVGKLTPIDGGPTPAASGGFRPGR